MNLAVVTNILTPYRVPLFQALHERVERLRVLLMADREENRQWEIPAGSFEYEVLPGFHVKVPAAEVSVHVNRGVMRALRRIDPDLVLSGGFAPANVAAWAFCRLRRRAFIGWGELSMQDVAKDSILRRGLRRTMTLWSDGSIASSSEAHDAFVHYGAPPTRILTSLMPVDVEYFHASARACRLSNWWRMERSRYAGPILLSVGRLTERKGYRELFAIYERLVQRRPDLSLLIVGDGPERARYEDHVRAQGWQHVRFLGFRHPPELIQYFALADAFIFHTLFDPFGAVLCEAMACEVPVASSIHAAATRDLIDHGVTGWRIDPREAAASAAALHEILQLGGAQREGLIARAYAKVKQSDTPATAGAMVAFMTSMLERAKR